MGYPIGARTKLRKKRDSLPNCHWNNKSKSAHRKRKKTYETLEEANAYIKKHNLGNDYIAYYCSYCSKYHIGHKTLT